MMKKCETIVYTSPSDSYDKICGKRATETWNGEPCCAHHFKLFQEQKEDRRRREQAALDEKFGRPRND